MPLFNKRYHPAGTAPGTLAKGQSEDARPLRIRLVDYDHEQITFMEDTTAEICRRYLDLQTITWIHVEGRPTVDALRELGAAFDLHNLALEDVLNTGQRAKVDAYAEHLFIVMSLPTVEDDSVRPHQVSLFLGDRYLISFCEAGFEFFEPIVRRLRSEGSQLRRRDADYLMYSLLDIIIDHAFPLLESFGAELEELEERILHYASRELMPAIHANRRELILLRRNLWPQRDVINAILRDRSPFIREDTLLYLRDCYDHTFQVIDLLETYREMSSSILEIYLSSVSNRMNEVMRVLTVIATIFIPLTFISGVYGMNFDPAAGPLSMPELGHPLGYVSVWGVMAATAVGMLLFFRSRKWF